MSPILRMHRILENLNVKQVESGGGRELRDANLYLKGEMC